MSTPPPPGYGYVPSERPPQYGYVPPRKNWVMRNKGLAAVGAGAVAIGAVVAVVATRGSSGPPAYLATRSGQVEFITWQQTGSGIQGTVAYDSITGTAPNEAVSVQSAPFTGNINGSTVTMTFNGGFLVGTATVTATVNGGTLSVSFIGSSGSYQTYTLTQSSASAYNAAVAALHRGVDHANLVAQQQQAQAQQAQANAQAEQTAQNDTVTVQQDSSLGSGSNFANDLSNFAADVNPPIWTSKPHNRMPGSPRATATPRSW